MRFLKKVLSVLLVMAMVTGMLPVTSFAAETDDVCYDVLSGTEAVETETAAVSAIPEQSDLQEAATETAVSESQHETLPLGTEFAYSETEETAESPFVSEATTTEMYTVPTEEETVPQQELSVITVHFDNSRSWETVNAHIWDSAGSDTQWPGLALQESNGWYTLTVLDTDGIFCCNFNNGNEETDTIQVEYTAGTTEFWYVNDALVYEELTVREEALAGIDPAEVTRVQWIQELVAVFSMTVEEDNYPDNYYSDISAEDSYYRDIMIAVEFGVIDLDAGMPFRPEDAATREFAAHTLNYCLGFQLEEDTESSFADAEDITYLQDAQIAVNRGWLALVNGAFQPHTPISKAEKAVMLEDAAAVLLQDGPKEEHENSAEFADGVILVPTTVKYTFAADNVIVIESCPVEIAAGDIFVLYSGTMPLVYKAVEAEQIGSELVIEYTTDGVNDAVLEYHVAGTVSADLESFEGTDAATYMVGDQAVYFGATRADINYDEDTKTLTATKDASLGDGVKATISVTISNLDFDLFANIATRSCRVVMNGTTSTAVNVSIPGDALEILQKIKSVPLGSVRVGGVGKITLYAEFALNGEITLTWVGDMQVGFSYSPSAGFRVIKAFQKRQFSFMTQINVKMGLKLDASVDVWFAQASIWGVIGADMTAKNTMYQVGLPSQCLDLNGFMYASVGVKATAFGFKIGDEKADIFTRSNSPIRGHYHYEDGKWVSVCSRGGDATSSSYYTNPNSQYFAPSDGSSSYTNAAGEVVKIYEYALDDNFNATITKYNGSAASVYIPSKIDGYKVIAIGYGAFRDQSTIRSVMIPDSVKTIEEQAFRNCTNLTTVEFPEMLTALNDAAFYNCVSLTSVNLPNSLTYISEQAFEGCASLTSVDLPDNLNSMGSRVFTDCKSLSTIVIPRTFTDAGLDGWNGIGVFSGCSSLKNIILEEGMLKVANYLCYDATAVEQITIPDSVVEIGKSAFAYATNLKTIVIPNSVKTVGESVFRDCTGLITATLPGSLTEVGEYMFYNCTSLREVTFPEGPAGIGKYAFQNCTSLTSITIPGTVRTIGTEAFMGDKQLADVVFHKGLESIGPRAFRDCMALKELQLPNTVTEINGEAFRNCDALKTVSIPESVTSIQYECFYNCDELYAVTIPDTVTVIPRYCFYECTQLEDVDLGLGVTEFESYAFYGCSSLCEIVIPYFATKIGYGAFDACASLKKAYIPANVTSIESYAFTYPTKTVIYGTVGSYAETWAKENGFAFAENTTKATAVTLTPVTLALAKGESCKLGLDISPANFGDTVTFKSGNTSVATVSASGEVKAVGVGEAKIKVIAGNASATCTVKVTQAVTYISLNKSTLALEVPKTYQLAATVSPSDASNKVLNWSSDNESAATVDENGLVTARGNGTAVITAAATDGSGKSAQCIITVTDPSVIPVTKITLNETILALPALYRQLLAATVYPSNATNKTLAWTSSNEAVATVDNAGYVTTVGKGVTTITAASTDGSKVSASCSVTVTNNGFVVTDKSELESAHPYESSCTDFWVYTEVGASEIRLTFDRRTEMEEGFDYLHIYNENGILQGTYTGTELAGKTIKVQGSRVTISLQTDESGVAWGFKVNSEEPTPTEPTPTDPTPTEPKPTEPKPTEPTPTEPTPTEPKPTDPTPTEPIPTEPIPTEPEDGYHGKCGENLKWSFDPDTGVLLISGTGAMDHYGKEKSPWYGYRDQITSLILPQGMTVIGKYSFYKMEKVKEVSIPEGVTEIGYGAFERCGLEKVSLPDSLITISDFAFDSCLQLKTIDLPESVATIGRYAFFRCGLETLYIPAGTIKIGEEALTYMKSLKSINVDTANPNYISDAYGVLYSKDRSILYQCPGAYTGEYTISDGVETVNTSAFWGCAGLTRITIPDSVKYMPGKDTFADCVGLTELLLPDEITTLNSQFAHGATNLETVKLPAKLTKLEDGAFYGCSSLHRIVIPSGVTIIEEYCFLRSALDSVFFLGSAPKIDAYAFGGVTTDAYYPGNDPTWTEDVMQDYGGSITWVPYYGTENVTRIEAENLVLNPDESVELTAILESGAVTSEEVIWTLQAEDGGTTLIGNGTSAVLTAGWYIHDTVVTVTAQTATGTAEPAVLELTILARPADYTLFSGKSMTLKEYDYSTGTYYPAKRLVWSTYEENAPYVTLTAAGRLTAKNVVSKTRILIFADIDGNPGFMRVVDILPAVTYVEIQDEQGKVVNGKTIPVDASSAEQVFTVTAHPLDTMQNVTWTISDAKNRAFAEYEINGSTMTVTNIKGTKAGTVTVTAMVDAGQKKNVSFKLQFGSFAKDVRITAATDQLQSGESLQLSAVTVPAKPTKSGITWSLSKEDKAYATISASGLLKAKPVYDRTVVTVIATSKDGQAESKYPVTILPAAEKLLILKHGEENVTKGTAYVDMNGSGIIALTAEYFDGLTQPTVTWTVPKSVKVLDKTENTITLQFQKAGTASITATGADKQKATVKLVAAQMAESVEIFQKKTNFTEGLEVASGKALDLQATVENAKNKKVIWSLASGDEAFAKISTSGKLTANKDLTSMRRVTVIATAADGSGAWDDVDVVIRPIAQGVQIYSRQDGRTLFSLRTDSSWLVRSNTTLEWAMNESETLQLSSHVYPYYGEESARNAIQGVTWKSSSAAIASVDEEGLVTCHKPGTVTITATAKDGSNKKVTVKLKVVKRIQWLDMDDQSVQGGKTLNLAKLIAINPTNATNKALLWEVVGGDGAAYVTLNAKTGSLRTKKVKEAVEVEIRAKTQDGSRIEESFTVIIKP